MEITVAILISVIFIIIGVIISRLSKLVDSEIFKLLAIINKDCAKNNLFRIYFVYV
jgi:hypothetical protein